MTTDESITTVSLRAPVAGPTCPVHPEVAAEETCARCGAFGCAECLLTVDEGKLCGACRALLVAELPRLEGPARVATMGLLGMGALFAAEHAVFALRIFVAPSVIEALSVLHPLAQLFTGFVFLRWFGLSVRHARARRRFVSMTPWQAVGQWFLPFANLVRPFDITRQLCREAPVGAWQATWVVGQLATMMIKRAPAEDQRLLAVVAGFTLPTAAILASAVVSRVSSAVVREVVPPALPNPAPVAET